MNADDPIELQVTSNYSFLRGASHVEELLKQAVAFGFEALALTDRNTLAGMARAHQRANQIGLRLIVGCRLDLVDFPSLLLFPTDREAYARLCHALSWGKRRGKNSFALHWNELEPLSAGLLAILLPERPLHELSDMLPAALRQLRHAFEDRAWCALTLERRPDDRARLALTEALCAQEGVPTVVTGDVLYHEPGRRILQDVVTCIREGCTIDAAGFRRERSVDRHLKTPEEIRRLFAKEHPAALAATRQIAGLCRFTLDELSYQYPEESETPGLSDQQDLERLVRERLPIVYERGVPPAVSAQLAHELAMIAELDYAPYFLTVNRIVRFARDKNILCQGRGSAANSAVCFVLGITAIDPKDGNLLFERFISTNRREPPDIDVDFEHERREEVIQWVFDHYGRDRAALCATVARYRPRGAVREVGKVLGLPEDVTGLLASQVWNWGDEGVEAQHAEAIGLNVADHRLRMTLMLAQELVGFPRHLGTHPGGFVLTRDRLDRLVPIEPAAMDNRQVIEWDKDDIETLRFMKVDILGLGMLGCMRRAFDLLHRHRGGNRMGLSDIPREDDATFDMICRADTLGTFQIESRAQMAMLPRLKPRELYDLVIQVAIVRPGPIQGDMVHPYLRRRDGLEKPEYPQESLRRVLKKTLGVPLFQEQAMQVAIHCAGFTPSEADQLRRSMATFKMTGGVSNFKTNLIEGMMRNGFARDFAERTFGQIEGFGSYGFPESHAAGFAQIAYASAWIKCHHPDAFCAALLNAQPMGFYAPAQIVRDAREHGIEVRPICVDNSDWDCTLEDTGGRFLAVRLGLRMVRGLAHADAERLVAARRGAWRSIALLHRHTGLDPAPLERIAQADGFASLGLSRRMALWQIRGLGETALPLFAARPHHETPEPASTLPALSEGGEVVADYHTAGLSLRRHPMALLRPELARRGISSCAVLAHARDGRRVSVAGLVLMRQRPGSAKGVMFMTLEDEDGIANLVIWPSLFEQQRTLILAAGVMACHGTVQRTGQVVHLVAHRLENLSAMLHELGREQDDAEITVRPRNFR
ncbi:error-prone DNA polymerase [Acetobacteraceae bacterium KSS8]|uniref:Error-prone DNA polymerase n=1 Tax=Endosaccharibacter trunci TaxID=2812733 RepID=A0ABT1W7E2_9PROT|nr:error-prone DNA polymerase [Acetobacteraceae bacterium KSS8]